MMTFTSTQSAFKAKFYQWAVSEVLEDLKHGFPLLHVVSNTLAAKFLSYIEHLSEDRRILLCRALVKRFNRTGAELSNDKMSPEELLEISIFDHTTMPLQEPERHNRSGIRRLLHECMSEAFPQSEIHWFRNGCLLQSQSGKWTVRTDIDMGGSYCSLTYRQSVLLSEQLVLAENVSILNWYGISGQTEWNLRMQDDEIFFGLKLVLNRFLDALPRLLPDSMESGG